MATEVADEPGRHRFTIRSDGHPAGLIEYRREPEQDRIVLLHTVVAPAYQGQGIGGALVRGALDLIRAEGGTRVVASCPYARAWLDKHEEYRDLEAPDTDPAV